MQLFLCSGLKMVFALSIYIMNESHNIMSQYKEISSMNQRTS